MNKSIVAEKKRILELFAKAHADELPMAEVALSDYVRLNDASLPSYSVGLKYLQRSVLKIQGALTFYRTAQPPEVSPNDLTVQALRFVTLENTYLDRHERKKMEGGFSKRYFIYPDNLGVSFELIQQKYVTDCLIMDQDRWAGKKRGDRWPLCTGRPGEQERVGETTIIAIE